MKLWKLFKGTASVVGTAADATFFTTVVAAKGAVGVYRFGKGVASLRHSFAADVECPAGHANPVSGLWECGHCRARYEGWVWVCPLCGSPTSYINCAECGLSIRNPYL